MEPPPQQQQQHTACLPPPRSILPQHRPQTSFLSFPAFSRPFTDPRPASNPDPGTSPTNIYRHGIASLLSALCSLLSALCSLLCPRGTISRDSHRIPCTAYAPSPPPTPFPICSSSYVVQFRCKPHLFLEHPYGTGFQEVGHGPRNGKVCGKIEEGFDGQLWR